MAGRHDYAFLHGGVQGGWVWAETLEAMAQQTGNAFGRALVLDVPGCGTKRGRATDELGIDEIAAELVADIEAAGLRDVVVVGHSQAGTILPRMIEQKPGLFRRAIHVSCIAPPPGQNVMEFSQVMFSSDGLDLSTSDPMDLCRAMFCNDMSGDQTTMFLGQLGEDSWPALSYAAADWRYEHLQSTPASYLFCLRDRALPLALQEVCALRLGTTRQIRIDAGHQVMITQPHALAEILRDEANAA